MGTVLIDSLFPKSSHREPSPLTFWKLDEAYAPASLNLGSLVENEETGRTEIKDIGADAQIDLARGVVVTHARLTPTSAEIAQAGAEFFGPDGRHAYDYLYYYNNIKTNAAKRVAAYKAGR